MKTFLAVLGLAMAPLFVSPLTAQEAGPLRGLSATESLKLGQGVAVIRAVANYRSLALSEAGAAGDRLRALVAAIRPNYVTEVIAIVPAADEGLASALLRRLAAALADPEGFVGIPYFSKRQEKTYDLFDKMELLTRSTIVGGEEIVARQHMEPFDDYRARYEYSLLGPDGEAAGRGTASALYFSSVSLDPIIYSYQKFKAVSPGNMVWALYAFRDGGRVVFYGVGAVRAFDLFGAFRDRLEASFTGRAEAFFGFMSGRMKADNQH